MAGRCQLQVVCSKTVTERRGKSSGQLTGLLDLVLLRKSLSANVSRKTHVAGGTLKNPAIYCHPLPVRVYRMIFRPEKHPPFGVRANSEKGRGNGRANGTHPGRPPGQVKWTHPSRIRSNRPRRPGDL